MKFHKSPPKEFWYKDCLTDTFKYNNDKRKLCLSPISAFIYILE